jgi:hypothetical protein
MVAVPMAGSSDRCTSVSSGLHADWPSVSRPVQQELLKCPDSGHFRLLGCEVALLLLPPEGAGPTRPLATTQIDTSLRAAANSTLRQAPFPQAVSGLSTTIIGTFSPGAVPKEGNRMQVSEAALQRAWAQLVAHFPFPGYLDPLRRSHLDVACTVSHYLPEGSRLLDYGAGPADKTALLAILGYKCTAMDDLEDEWHTRGEARQMILDFAADMGIDFVVLDGEGMPVTADFDMVMLHKRSAASAQLATRSARRSHRADSYWGIPLHYRPQSREPPEAPRGATRQDEPCIVCPVLLVSGALAGILSRVHPGRLHRTCESSRTRVG